MECYPRASAAAAPSSSCDYMHTITASAVPKSRVSRKQRDAARLLPSQQRVLEVVRKQAVLMEANFSSAKSQSSAKQLPGMDEAYAQCSRFIAQKASNFHLGISLLTPEQRKALSAIFAWGIVADEIVDGPEPGSKQSFLELERYQERLENIFYGKPLNAFDIALADTVTNYSLDIQLFRDLMAGMKQDLVKSRYATFDEVYLYSYYVAGTGALMLIPILGLSSSRNASRDLEGICEAGVTVAIATQLTNILRDVGEDAKRGRIYLPQDELARSGLRDEDIFAGVVTEEWRAFVKQQIQRARSYYAEAGKVVPKLNKGSRWPVWASISIYQQLLNSIEENDFDNFNKRAKVSTWKKLMLGLMSLFRI